MENTNVFKKKIGIAVLAVIGILTTIKLALIYYDANFNPYALASFCSVNEFIDCDGVAKTAESQFFGIPLAYWGMFLYAFMIFMLFVDKLKNVKFLKFLEVFKNPLDYIASLGVISFLISMILLGVSLFDIKKICILCMFTYILNLLIGMIATDFKNGGFINSFKQSVIDFIDAIKVKKYLIAFIAVVLFACSALTYTATSFKFAPQAKRQLEFKEFVNHKNKYKVSGNILGDKDAKLIVNTYTDYRCPICSAHNIMMHKLAKELKGIKIVHHNLPLDMECNGHLMQPFHQGSCMMARYGMAAEKQGKFWDMNTLMFDNQPKNEAEIIDLAGSIDLDTDKLMEDANSVEISKKLHDEIEEAYKKGFNGTPTTMINKDAYVGIKTYKEYKEWFIKSGAKNR